MKRYYIEAKPMGERVWRRAWGWNPSGDETEAVYLARALTSQWEGKREYRARAEHVFAVDPVTGDALMTGRLEYNAMRREWMVKVDDLGIMLQLDQPGDLRPEDCEGMWVQVVFRPPFYARLKEFL